MTTSTATATVTSLTMSITYSRPADGWPTMTITGVPVDVDDVFVTVTATPYAPHSHGGGVHTDVQAVSVHGTARGQKVTWNTELQALPEFIGELTGQAQDAATNAIGAVL